MIDLVGMNLGFVHFSCVYQFVCLCKRLTFSEEIYDTLVDVGHPLSLFSGRGRKHGKRLLRRDDLPTILPGWGWKGRCVSVRDWEVACVWRSDFKYSIHETVYYQKRGGGKEMVTCPMLSMVFLQPSTTTGKCFSSLASYPGCVLSSGLGMRLLHVHPVPLFLLRV